MADYGIFAVQYDQEHNHIIQVKAAFDHKTFFGPLSDLQRQNVINLIKGGITFVTVYKEGINFRRGEDVRIVRINNIEYIRTDNNNTTKDNLGNLPEY